MGVCFEGWGCVAGVNAIWVNTICSHHCQQQHHDRPTSTQPTSLPPYLVQVGSGSFSNVYLALWRGTPVALKRLILRDMGGQDQAAVRMELVDCIKKELAITAGTWSRGCCGVLHNNGGNAAHNGGGATSIVAKLY